MYKIHIIKWRKISVTLSLLFIISLAISGFAYAQDKETFKADAKELKQTAISPVLTAGIEDNKNVIWCSTFQLAWNVLKDKVIKEDIKLNEGPDLVNELNGSSASKRDLSKKSYVAMAGFGADEIVEKINKELKKKFKNPPELKDKLKPTDIMAYAYLFKELEFKEEFDKIKELLDFKGVEVPAFGIEKFDFNKHERFQEQIEIYDYKSEDDFIIKLKSKKRNDEIILAKVAPGENLHLTYQSILDRIQASEKDSMAKDDTLQIPKFDYDFTKSYDELKDKVFENSGWESYVIKQALQNIKFKMNEKGVVLKSEAKIRMEMVSSTPVPPRKFIFDKEFIIILKERKRQNPYFVMWVDNAEVLLK